MFAEQMEEDCLAVDHKDRFKILKKKLIIGAAIVLLLALAYFSAGNDGGTDSARETGEAATAAAARPSGLMSASETTDAAGENVSAALSREPDPTEEPEGTVTAAGTKMPEPTGTPAAGNSQGISETPEPANTSAAANTPTAANSPEPTNTPAAAVTPEPTRLPDGQQYCYISIDCKNAVLNAEELNPALAASLPEDGVVLVQTKVSFENGDTVFDVLKKTAGQQGIALEYSTTPVYGGIYVEGIAELYEFDCGALSGWMYTVNDVAASVAASEYKLKNGDVVKWVYTCDLGSDI